MNLEVLKESQKKRMINWEIPHLMTLLKNQYQLHFMHLITSPLPFLCERDWFFLEGKVVFPLFLRQNFLGVLICFLPPTIGDKTFKKKSPSIKFLALEIRVFIDAYFQNISSSFYSKKRNKGLFLLKQNKKQDILKTAHNLYLKTSAFAFLKSEDFKWEEGVFQEMNGVFVCIPSFEELSQKQKKVLKQGLKKKLGGFLVIGFKKELPKSLSFFEH